MEVLKANDDHTLKLLIVDDDDVDRERIRRMLSKSDIETSISEASSVEDSMDFLSNNDYDCVIVDYRLGLNSGLTLLNNIRTIMESHCAVIMVTGLGDEEVAAEAMRLGASDYLLKNQLQSTQLIRAITSSIHRAELEKKLHDMAHYDNLTGLASRPLLLENLQQIVINEDAAAVAFLDLDNFKPVNDNYGHDIGDYVLVTIANRLKQVARKNDILARIGGDEFVLLLRDVSSEKECSGFLNRLIELINTPIELAKFDCQVQVSASIGVALVSNDGLDADTILRRADQTMYQAKNMGRNNIIFFDPEEESRQYARRAMLQAAERGIVRHEFELHYQPQIDMVNHKIIGVEALIRWNHPTMGFLYPVDFTEVLEHPSTGVLIGEWVLQEALRQHNIWQKNDLVISVNIAPAHLLSKDFVQRLDQLLKSIPNFNPNLLEIEILETVSISDILNAVEVVKACCKLGIHVALDDFGTGYSSLNYLKQLPLNTLKIDRSFIQNILSDPEDRAIVACIVALSKAFNYKLIAEGVESLEHEQALIDIGCLCGQGYFIAKPMAAGNMTIWIQYYSQKHSVH
ncbi:MAG: GGDEF domain-containing response regulator [Gammaproteobacteria bacterium]|jgi:diguanylate cyclase (GGDEF)-like protein|uniref:Diguanylate cyclase (GGDEF) domain-containing protein n=1 Tax=Marinomonas polaris DSM 16579 TaxID=1122206 RepID=A0A1M5DNT1_9GAMM|nr:GGDEF domain-containing response regulator [Marinomonas polaris]MBU1293183.1 GGDEF domain-containing response regulator [Gammaproteobacteria bacterium]MBU1465438.1 GGDEF domain-containing response regulator [Gammaproteobacteria bacterium]MBU2023919.1 GGDEF domain-containing response regulator [Gammaproteobacteria bacterium]MBU2236967.1 GGDEF domain-containing response regulator [Gammaproteobacteria bacterium]MBU2320182.1 GGDEF domain-containing response regulator [Gammaproteobacteria bacter|tara:strand:- start:6635 stop:8353 length:1719 start_codon:yes stop_codon:yes gene_type:complete